MRWEDKQEVKKGDMGENFLDQYLFQTGKWIPYLPVFDGPHPFDRIAASLDKKEWKPWKALSMRFRRSRTGYRSGEGE